MWEGPRGAPDNSGNHFTAVHPVVRTHPTTGWKSVYCGGTQCRRINELTSQESEEVITKLMRMIMENHDLQVRFRWHYPGDIGEQLQLSSSSASYHLSLLNHALHRYASFLLVIRGGNRSQGLAAMMLTARPGHSYLGQSKCIPCAHRRSAGRTHRLAHCRRWREAIS